MVSQVKEGEIYELARLSFSKTIFYDKFCESSFRISRHTKILILSTSLKYHVRFLVLTGQHKGKFGFEDSDVFSAYYRNLDF